MIDMSATLTRRLRSDSAVMAAAGDRVYADLVPENTAYPYVVVRTLSVTPAAPPTLSWDTYETQVDIVGEPEAYADTTELADLVRASCAGVTGMVDGTAAVAAADVATFVVDVDTTVTPARPRWVLAVEVTARNSNREERP